MVTVMEREPDVDCDGEPDGESVDEPHCDAEALDESDGDLEAVTDALMLREGDAEGVLDSEVHAVALLEKGALGDPLARADALAVPAPLALGVVQYDGETVRVLDAQPDDERDRLDVPLTDTERVAEALAHAVRDPLEHALAQADALSVGDVLP